MASRLCARPTRPTTLCPPPSGPAMGQGRLQRGQSRRVRVGGAGRGEDAGYAAHGVRAGRDGAATAIVAE